jgi:hypothetical protein
MFVLIALLLSFVVPVIATSVVLDGNLHAWAKRYRDTSVAQAAGAGVFRSTVVRESRWSVVGSDLPRPVFIAAMSAFFLGQMYVPTAPAAMAGLLIGLENFDRNAWTIALSVSWLAGSLSAIYTFRTGAALLRGKRAVAERMAVRNFAYSLTHNAALFALCAWTGTTTARDGILAVLGYAAVVLLQGLAMVAFVRAYRAHFVADDPDAKLVVSEVSPSVPALN